MFKNGNGEIQRTLTSPLIEDFALSAETQFSSFADFCPTIDSLVDLANAYTSSVSGKVDKEGMQLRAILDAPRWKKTEPVKLTTVLHFYTETNPKEDVIDKVNLLMGLHVLTKTPEGRFLVPGLCASNLSELTKDLSTSKNGKITYNKTYSQILASRSDEENDVQALLDNMSPGKLVTVFIPGVVYMNDAFVSSITPTYSKHITDSGYPLWANVDIVFQSLTPANTSHFQDGASMAIASNELQNREIG